MKGIRYESKDQLDISGLGVSVLRKYLVVFHVDPDGAGKAAGIATDDMIARIDGKESRAISAFEIRQLFSSEEGRKNPLEISRSGETIQTTLTLKPAPFHE